jgi:hypothetical protein
MMERLPRDAEPDEQGWFDTAATASCVAPDQLLALGAGSLPAAVAARVEAHLSACSKCRALLEAMTALEGGPTAEEAQRISASVARSRPRPSAVWRPGWLAAAAAVLAALGLAVMIDQSDDVRPLVGAPSRDRELPTPAFALRLEKPAIDLPPEALALRGSGASPYFADLSAALQPWRQDRFEEAAAQFRNVTARYPDRPHGFFYLGVSLLMADRAGEAFAPLQRARALAADDAALRASATWYLAVSFERSGQTAAAIQALAELCEGGGARHDEGCRGLSALRPPPGESGAHQWGTPSAGGTGHGGDRSTGGSADSRRPVPVH